MVPMEEDRFPEYLERAVRRYAQENIRAGYRTEHDALAISRQDHLRLLPQGLSTPDNYLMTVKDSSTGFEVGVIWFKMEATEQASAFIYDVFIKEAFRDQGYGRATMKALERFARERGLRSLLLHVFAHNSTAIHLYESVGFEVKSMNMEKRLI